MALWEDGHALKWAAAGSAVLAGIAARSLLKRGWRRMKDEEPPENPASEQTGWGDALLWTAATGLAVGMARLLARRSATALLKGDAPAEG